MRNTIHTAAGTAANTGPGTRCTATDTTRATRAAAQRYTPIGLIAIKRTNVFLLLFLLYTNIVCDRHWLNYCLLLAIGDYQIDPSV